MRKTDIDWTLAAMVALVLAVAVAAPAAWIASSHFEAKAYNRLTGKDVTTWEAMWVELRVEGGGDG